MYGALSPDAVVPKLQFKILILAIESESSVNIFTQPVPLIKWELSSESKLDKTWL